MKKACYYFFILSAIALIAFACNKSENVISSELISNHENDDDLKTNEATWIYSHDDSKFLYLKMQISIGHTSNQCGNKCVKIFGQPGHIDCRGFGNVCSKIVDVHYSMEPNGDLRLILCDTAVFGESLDMLLPDRTLFITNPQNNNELWLNIPEQLLIRDSESVPFVIHDIWFSENPELENL